MTQLLTHPVTSDVPEIEAFASRAGDLVASGLEVLVLHGSSDPVTSTTDALAGYDGVPDARVRVVNGELPDVISEPAASGAR